MAAYVVEIHLIFDIKAKAMFFTVLLLNGKAVFLMRKYLKIYFSFVADGMYMDHISPLVLFFGIVGSPLFLAAFTLQKLEEIKFFKD